MEEIFIRGKVLLTNTIVLPKEHRNKMTPICSSVIPTDQCLSQLPSEKLPLAEDELIPRPRTGQWAENERPWNTQSSTKCLHQTCSLRAQGASRKRRQRDSKRQGVMKDTKERVSRPKRTEEHMNPQTGTACTEPARVQARWSLHVERGSRYRPPPRSYRHMSATHKRKINLL